MKARSSKARLFLGLVSLGILAAPGCAGMGDARGALDVAAARSRSRGRPLVVLVVDPSRGEADAEAERAFLSVAKDTAGVDALVLKLDDSRNRAAAAPMHALEGPTLVARSPGGMIVSRDDGPITADLARDRAEQAALIGKELDQEYARLSGEVARNPGDADARMGLAEFLVARQNEALAIPHLQTIADDGSADVGTRIKAWVMLGKAHLWVVEPEKARHAAQALLTTLGEKHPEAVAGGNLVRGLQDAKAKRYGRAKEEFEAAVAAAPTSEYGKEAGEGLAALPKGGAK